MPQTLEEMLSFSDSQETQIKTKKETSKHLSTLMIRVCEHRQLSVLVKSMNSGARMSRSESPFHCLIHLRKFLNLAKTLLPHL